MRIELSVRVEDGPQLFVQSKDLVSDNTMEELAASGRLGEFFTDSIQYLFAAAIQNDKGKKDGEDEMLQGGGGGKLEK